MESIKSVQENPFFKHFGIRHNVPSVSRANRRSETTEQVTRQTLSSADEDEIGEYRPVSGFVHKLLDKFSSLGAKEEHAVSHSLLKRFSSFDELAVGNEVTSNKTKTSTDAAVDSGMSYVSTKLSQKAKSIECLHNAHLKPQQYSSYGVSLRAHKNLEQGKQSTASKAQRDDLARDDIIIIENITSAPLKGLKSGESNGHDGTLHVVSGREVASNDELPKPNTVLTVRNIFESASSGTSLYSRRQKSDLPLSPSSLQTEIITTGQDSVSKRGSIQIPSPVTSPRHDTYAKPVLLPSSITHSRPFDSSRRPSDSHLYSRTEDVKSLVSVLSVSSGTNYSKSQMSSRENTLLSISSISTSDSNSVRNDNKSSNLEGGNFDASKSSISQHSTSLSRSMASVKPTVNSKQNTPVKAVPLSPPASTTTSYNRSRPVVSVAPYKDKPEDTKDDGQPVMIFSKSKLSPRGENSQRTNDHTQFSNLQKELKEEEMKQEKDIILPKEATKFFEEDVTANDPNNKISSHGKKSNDVDNKNVENTVFNRSKITQTKHRTTIEVRNTSDFDKEQLLLDEKSKGTDKKSDLNAIKPAAESSTQLTKPKRMAPEPPKQLQLSKSGVTSSATPKTELIEKDLNKNSTHIIISEDSQREIPTDINAPSKPSSLKVTETISEQPLQKVIKDKPDASDEPVKGIPSIISQRLKQQNSNPSQVSYDVVNSSDTSIHSNNLESTNIYSRALLAPARADSGRSSSDNTEKDTLSSEIENEITAVRRKIEANRLKAGGPAQIFDSSQLVKKKKENQKRQTSSDGFVPSLDLSSINGDDILEYQPQVKKIKPCNIVFIGENAKTSRSLLDKKRKVKAEG